MALRDHGPVPCMQDYKHTRPSPHHLTLLFTLLFTLPLRLVCCFTRLAMYYLPMYLIVRHHHLKIIIIHARSHTTTTHARSHTTTKPIRYTRGGTLTH